MNKKELLLISYFRNNARENLTKISRKTGIPVSTIFDKLKKYEKGLIKKHTSLIDFQKLGFDIRINTIFKVNKDDKEKFKDFLIRHSRINSIYKINNGFDFLVEGIFRNMHELDKFLEKVDEFKIENREDYYVVEDIKREAFLCNKELIETVVK